MIQTAAERSWRMRELLALPLDKGRIEARVWNNVRYKRQYGGYYSRTSAIFR